MVDAMYVTHALNGWGTVGVTQKASANDRPKGDQRGWQPCVYVADSTQTERDKYKEQSKRTRPM